MRFTIEDAKNVMKFMKLSFKELNIKPKDLMIGMNIELEHSKYNKLNVGHHNPITTAKIALAHLIENNKYYDILRKANL